MKDWFVVYKKSVADVVGIIPAILYATLQRKAKSYAEKGMINDSGEFFATTNDIMATTSMTADQIKLAIKKLESAGLLVVKVRGVPPKRHFKLMDFSINEEVNNWESQLMENPPIKEWETPKTINGKATNSLVENPLNIKNINKSINKNINKNIELGNFSQNSNANEKPKQQKFIKPTEQEVFNEMYQKLGDFNQAELLSQKFIAHYESVGWKVGKNPMKNWKACVRTWLLSEKQKQPSKQQWKPNKEKTTDELVSEGLKDFKKHFGFDLGNNNSVIDITNQQIGQIGVNNDSN